MRGATGRQIGLVLPILFAVAFPSTLVEAQAKGEELFRSTCAACHTTNTDRLVGPGLEGVEDRRDREWLLSVIMEPDRLIAEGDTIANRLLDEYLVPMPNLGTTRAQAESVLDFITDASGALSVNTTVLSDAPITEDQVFFGMALFQGNTRLVGGGPTCNGCHEVINDAVIGGGILARINHGVLKTRSSGCSRDYRKPTVSDNAAGLPGQTYYRRRSGCISSLPGASGCGAGAPSSQGIWHHVVHCRSSGVHDPIGPLLGHMERAETRFREPRHFQPAGKIHLS